MIRVVVLTLLVLTAALRPREAWRLARDDSSRPCVEAAAAGGADGRASPEASAFERGPRRSPDSHDRERAPSSGATALAATLVLEALATWGLAGLAARAGPDGAAGRGPKRRAWRGALPQRYSLPLDLPLVVGWIARRPERWPRG
jgi:hypothetical protein